MNSNFKRKLIAWLFAPVLGLTVGSALAQSAPSGSGGAQTGSASAPPAAAAGGMTTPTNTAWDTAYFNRVDKNGDGRISREEAQADARMKDAWSKLDTANSGSVSREDFDKYARTLNPNSANPVQNNVPGKGPQK